MIAVPDGQETSLHLGVLCPPLPAHYYGMTSLAQALQKRGHRVTLFGLVDIEEKVRSEGVGFAVVGLKTHPQGTLIAFHEQMARLSGLPAARNGLREAIRENRMLADEIPELISRAGISALLADVGAPIGGSIAEYTGIPFMTINNGLPVNREPEIPPCIAPWGYSNSWWGRLRNRAGYAAMDWITRPLLTALNEQRRRWNLRPYGDLNEGLSPWAQISKLVPSMDFPRRELPDCFHYTGPFSTSSPTFLFPYERLDGRPLVYATMGTVSRMAAAYRAVAAACEGLGVQLVISLGGGDENDFRDLPGSPIVVRWAPQADLMSRAVLTVSHVGFNTAMGSLVCGVPIVAVPVTSDQVGVAARIRWSGVGEVVPFARLSSGRLRSSIRRVLDTPSYRNAAAQIQSACVAAGGGARAAAILEDAVARFV